MSKFYTHLNRVSALFGNDFFSLEVVRGCSAPYCKFGTPYISETSRARKLKFCTHLDKAKYSVLA